METPRWMEGSEGGTSGETNWLRFAVERGVIGSVGNEVTGGIERGISLSLSFYSKEIDAVPGQSLG